ncbi:helix-turn-helix protein [compost metagenome]
MRRNLGRCRLNEILIELGWSQQQLSDYSDVPKGQISRYLSDDPEQQRKISLRDAIAITDAVRVYANRVIHPRELYEGTLEPPVRRSVGES